MKNIFPFLVLSACLLFVNNIYAQSPPLINYQAVARDVSGNLLVTTPVNIVFDVLQGPSPGTLVYSETHVLSTNQFGLFTAEIGGGTPVFGTFSGVNWGLGIYYLRVTVNGDVMTASQLLSVPYALHANTATSGISGANGHANLADSITEPSGPNCPNGGYLIYMGADDNDDDTLQFLERDIQYYICNGLDGAANNNDTSATNELQTLSISNDTIFLFNGGFVVLPASSGSLWNINGQGIDYQAGSVGIGTATPVHKLTVNSSDSVIASFTGNNSAASIIGISNTNSGAAIGTIFLSGSDTAILALDPTQKLLGISNNINGGHIGINSDSTIASYSKVISHVAENFVFNNTDTIFNISPTGAILNINQGAFITDSLYIVGNNKDSLNWVLVNDGFGQAKWTNPSSLNFGGGLWGQGTGDIYNSTDSVGIGVTNPLALLHVSGGGLTQPIALFEKGGFLNAAININHTGSNGSGINFQNGATTTSNITSTSGNVLSLSSQFVEVGNSPKTGFFNVAGLSSVTKPTILLHEPSTGLSRIKHTNTVANKYWIVEAGLNVVDGLSGYSIGYNNGVSTTLPFLVYGDNKVGINNIAPPLGSFHVMDINTAGNGIISEGFNQPGLVVIGRNNFTSPNRGAINNGDEIGKIIFPGYHAGGFGDGPKISAKATENYLSTSNGSEMIFSTIANGTITHIDALKLLNDGRAEIPVGLFIPNGAGVSKVLTSDAIGNASWQTIPSLAIWSKSGANIFQNILTDFVGIGTNTPLVKLHVVQDGQATVAVQSSNNNVSDGGALALVRTRGTSVSPLGVQNGDRLGKLEFVGMDNALNFSEAVSIRAFADEAFGSTAHGSHLEFHTTPIGIGVSNEAMRIAPNGNIGIGRSAPSAKLDVNGTFKLTDGTEGNGKVLTSDPLGNATWQTPSGANSKWDVLGNLGTIDGTNFIGTTDNVPLNFRVNNQPAGRIDPALSNVFFGDASGSNIGGGSLNTYYGSYSGFNNTTGSTNTFIGGSAGYNNISGSANTAVGYYAGYSTTGSFNTFIGEQAAANNSSGSFNSFLGRDAGQQNTTGGNNTFLGYQAGLANTIGSNNVILGYNANVSINNLTNAIAIGANATVSQSNSLVLGNNVNVGIGTSTPSAKLDVNGTFKLTDGTEGAGKILVSDAAGAAQWNGPIVFRGAFAPTGALGITSTAQTVGGTAAYSGAITYNTSPVGFGGNMNISNMRFRASENGYYKLHAAVYVAINSSQTVIIQLYNLTTSTVIHSATLNNPAASQVFYSMDVSAISLLNTSDDVVVRVLGGGASSGLILSNATYNTFEATLIR